LFPQLRRIFTQRRYLRMQSPDTRPAQARRAEIARDHAGATARQAYGSVEPRLGEQVPQYEAMISSRPPTAMSVPATTILNRFHLPPAWFHSSQAIAIQTPAIMNRRNATSATVTPALCENPRRDPTARDTTGRRVRDIGTLRSDGPSDVRFVRAREPPWLGLTQTEHGATGGSGACLMESRFGLRSPSSYLHSL